MSAPRPLGGSRRIFVIEYRRPSDSPAHGWKRRYYLRRGPAIAYGKRRIAQGFAVRTVTVTVAETKVNREFTPGVES